MEYILETCNLEKKYKNFKAISNLNMNVEKGAIYGLIGENGAGKTTLIRIVCGLQKPTKGTYLLYGVSNENKNINTLRKKIGAIIETPAIFLDMNAEENLKEQYKIKGLPDCEGINELLKLVGLTTTSNKKARNFSLGMKQRLGIAIALVGNPDFLILDEPMNGLDPQLNKEKGITFIVSSHYLDELSKIATHYGFMHKGKMLKEISCSEIQEKEESLEAYYMNLIGGEENG